MTIVFLPKSIMFVVSTNKLECYMAYIMNLTQSNKLSLTSPRETVEGFVLCLYNEYVCFCIALQKTMTTWYQAMSHLKLRSLLVFYFEDKSSVFLRFANFLGAVYNSTDVALSTQRHEVQYSNIHV